MVPSSCEINHRKHFNGIMNHPSRNGTQISCYHPAYILLNSGSVWCVNVDITENIWENKGSQYVVSVCVLLCKFYKMTVLLGASRHRIYCEVVLPQTWNFMRDWDDVTPLCFCFTSLVIFYSTKSAERNKQIVEKHLLIGSFRNHPSENTLLSQP